MMLLFVLFSLVGVRSPQKIIELSSLIERRITVVRNETTATAVYMSASTANPDLLNYIKVVAGMATFKTGATLINRRNGSFLLPWVVTGNITVYIDLTMSQKKLLTGFIYLTTEQQAKDKKFRVYDVATTEKLKIGTTFRDLTIVFFNSLRFRVNWQTTSFSNWDQENGTSVFLYEGVPMDEPEMAKTQIFSNPVQIGEQFVKFDRVNDFMITLSAFYMRIRDNAGFKFTIIPEYTDIDSKLLRPPHTGFVMKAHDDIDKFTVISKEKIDQVYFGVNCIADVPEKGYIDITARFGDNYTSTYFNTSREIVTKSVETDLNQLVMTSVEALDGQYFIQYYILKPGSLPVIGLFGPPPTDIPADAT